MNSGSPFFHVKVVLAKKDLNSWKIGLQFIPIFKHLYCLITGKYSLTENLYNFCFGII